MNDGECAGCGAAPGPGSVARMTGKDASGHEVSLCSRCFIERARDRQPASPMIRTKKK